MKILINIIKVFFANGINILSGFGVTILLSESLSITLFGDYAILLSVLALVLIVPNSLNAGSILFLTNAGDESDSHFKTLLLFRSVVSAVLLLVITVISQPLSSYLHAGRVPFYLYIFLGIQGLFSSMEKQILQQYQVQERFTEFSRLTLLARSLKIAGTAIVWYFGLLTLNTAIMILVFTQILAVITSLKIFNNATILNVAINKQLISKLIHYSGWILLSQLLVYIGTRANIIMISRYLTTIETGYFGFAITLLQGLFLLSQSVVSVITPKILNHNDIVQKKKLITLFIGLSMAYLFVVIIAPQFATLLVTKFMEGKYLESTALFTQLAPAAWLFMISTGPMILFHRWEQTKTIAFIECCGAITLIICNIFLLPTRGLEGAVLSMIASRLTTVIIMGAFILQHYVQTVKCDAHYLKVIPH